MMGRCGLYSCCVLIATFLSLWEIPTTQGQQVELVTEPDAMYTVARKQAANITCEAYDAAKITFTCSGTQIPPSSHKTYESYDESRGQTLVRSTIQVSRSDVENYAGDDGFWCECSAWQDDVTKAATSRRAVFELAYIKREFIEEPVSQSARLSEMVVFNCIPDGKPFPEILWRKDGRRINYDDDDNYMQGADGSLTIVTVRQQDAGAYECVAKNDAGRRQSEPAMLTIAGYDDRTTAKTDAPMEEPTTSAAPDTAKTRSPRQSSGPVFYEEPAQNVYVTPTETVQIVCDVQGADILTVRCNGQRMERDKLETKEDRAARKIRALLNLTYAEVENYKNTYREDKYECECIAWYTEPGNPNWQFSTSQMGSVFLAYLDEAFQTEPRDVRAQTGTSATITCSPPEGKPDPWVYWVFESQRLDPRTDNRYVVDRDGSLTIRSVTQYDSGRYYCVAENQMGMRQSRVGTLTVSDEPVESRTEPPVMTTAGPAYVPTFPSTIPSEPVFIKDLEPVYYLNSQGVATLITSVVAADMLTYRCNGERLQADEQVIDVQTDRASGKRLLTATTEITQREIEDSQVDEYSCQAFAWYIKGGEWKFLTGSQAVILPAYLDADFLYEPQGDLYYLGDAAEFACQPPMGQPQPKVSWVKDGVMLDPEADDNLVVMQDGTLIVESVRREDAGQYVCVATNAAGSRRSRPAVLELADTGFEEDTTTTTTMRTTERIVTYPSPSPSPTGFPGPEDVTGGPVLPIFIHQPAMENYIIRDTPVTLTCGVVAATVLIFNCNGERMKEASGTSLTDPASGLPIIERSIVITKEMVEEHDAQSTLPYTCQCRAYYRVEGGEPDDFEYVPSEDAFVTVAYFKKRFQREPVSQSVELGVATELQCHPPLGSPPPTVYWLKDGYRLTESNNYRVTEEGSLIIESVMEDDVGNYTCVAQNVVKTHYSNTVSVTLMTDGLVPPSPSPDTGDVDEGAEEEDKDEEGTFEPTPEAEVEGEVEVEGEAEGETVGETEGEAEGETEGEAEGETEGEAEGEYELEPDVAYPPEFIAQPDPMYYIIKSNPVTISCQARGADRITFNCNAESVPESRVQYQDILVNDGSAPGSQGSILSASIDVSREEVENYNDMHGTDEFWCQCNARYTVPSMSDSQSLASRKGYVQVAYLKRRFVREPEDRTVQEGEFLSLPCEPPEGRPEPEVYWEFNGERVTNDIPNPDHAYIIGTAGPLNAGTYVCVAENVASRRTSRPALVYVQMGEAVVTGAPVEGGEAEGGPEPTPEAEYEETGPVATEGRKRCIELIQQCSSSFIVTQKDQQNCEKASHYVACIDSFIAQCTGVMDKKSMMAARQTRDKAETACSPTSDQECQEMRKCESEYSQQSVASGDANTMPMVTLCAGIHTFLRCADRAAGLCNIRMDNNQTSLTDLAAWFEQYCERVVEDDWAGQCSALSRCDLPIDQATVLANLVQSSLWCPYVQKTMDCTAEAVTECDLEDVDDDLEHLARLADDTCPAPQAEGEAEGTGAGTGETKDSPSTGENGGWSARGSLLMTSLLPVVFVLLTCR